MTSIVLIHAIVGHPVNMTPLSHSRKFTKVDVDPKEHLKIRRTYGGGRMVKSLLDITLGCIANNLNSISCLGQYLPSVHKELLIERLSNHDMLTSSYMPHVTYNLFSTSIRRIRFYRCEQITDQVLISLAQSGCRLQELTIKMCHNVTDVGLQAITRGQDELTLFSIKRLSGTGDRGLSELKSRNLHTLKVVECRDMTPCAIKTVINHNPFVKVLNLNNCVKLDDSIFPVIATTLRENLEELHCRDVHCMTDPSLSMLAEYCPNLHSMDLLSSSKISRESMQKVFQNCSKLKFLDLSYCTKLQTKPDTEVLKLLPESLQELSLCGVFIDDRDLLVDSLKPLVNIRKIRLCGIPSLNDDALTEILSGIGEHLEGLDLSGCLNLTDDGMRSISKYCKCLEEMALTQVKNITGLPLKPLFQNEKIADQFKRLDLRCNQFNEDIMFNIASNCHHLEMLDIAGLQIATDDLMLCIAENCPKITRLFIKGCKQVTDRGICEIARCCPLTALSVSGLHNLTDKSVFALANNCHYLEEFYLNGCAQVTRVALRYLLDCCIPRVFIMHKVPNASPNQLMAKNLDTGEFCRVDLMN